MKALTGFVLTGVLLTGQLKAQSFQSPDISVDTKLDYDWSSMLVKKIRTLLVNYHLADPFSGRFEDTMVLNESKVGDFLPEDSKHFIKMFGEASGLNILKTETKVSMTGFSYDVKGFRTNLKVAGLASDGIILNSDFRASEVTMSAEKVTLSVMIPGKTNSPVFDVEIINPSFAALDEDLVNFSTRLKIQDHKDHFKFLLEKANFSHMSQGLLGSQRSVDFNYERLIIPEVSLKIGNKTVHFSPEKIENLIREKHEAIKGILIAQVASLLEANTMEAALKIVEKYKLNKSYWLPTSEINSLFALSDFSSESNGEIITINSGGDYCTKDKFTQFGKDCVSHKVTQTAPSRLTKKFHDESRSLIKNLIQRGDADIVASISEDYLNKLLVSTYDAGLWTSALEGAGVTLGPNKVILRLDKKGESGTLIMDVVYKPSKMEKLLTGSREIRFPLVLDLSVRIEKNDQDPVVIIHLNDVDTSDETIINGRPDLGINSTVKDVPRFRGKVAKAIREKVSVLRNTDIIELAYPDFRGCGLHKVDFLSDGKGRMNAMLRMEDLVQDEKGL